MPDFDVVVVGGCGHVGLPLGIALAGAGMRVAAYDLDQAKVDAVNSGEMPFSEPGGPERLGEVLAVGRFAASTYVGVASGCEYVVVVVGTPVDEHLNPDIGAVPAALADLVPHLRAGQVVVLRSTIYPGVTRLVEEFLAETGLDVEVAFCPERIAEGKAFDELYSLPQIVAARSEAATAKARKLFEHLTPDIVECSPEEAELAKLFTNSWRYIKFAVANQFFMIANDFGVDFERVRTAITHDYPRAEDMPGAGFAAGPCLFKDTMQLAAFNDNNFLLGHSAMLINEGLPLYLVSRLERAHDLKSMTVGILGMSFKAESDDIRSSLAYKLRRLLRYKAKAVVCHDPFVAGNDGLLPLDEVLERAHLLVIAAPHRQYQQLDTSKPVVDIWNLLGRGVIV